MNNVAMARAYLRQGFSSYIGSYGFMVIASSLFPRIPLGASSGLGAFGATPGTPHLGCPLELPSEHHRAAHCFGDMFSKLISFSNHVVIIAEE
jgi:hypothetical protein